MSGARLDRGFTFGEQLSFLIPPEWIEAEEQADHYLHPAPNADSGWFRVAPLVTVGGAGKASEKDRGNFSLKSP